MGGEFAKCGVPLTADFGLSTSPGPLPLLGVSVLAPQGRDGSSNQRQVLKNPVDFHPTRPL